MRRVIIQLFCIYFSIIYLIAFIIFRGMTVAPFLLICAASNLIVAVKIMKFKARTNMFYNSIFLFLSFLSCYFIFTKFPMMEMDLVTSYLYLTFPQFLKDLFVILNFGIFLVALVEFLNSKTID